jgi:GNAT superfamily N-acetyltransferase
MIRGATLDDMPELMRMGRAFYAASPYAAAGVAMVEDDVAAQFRDWIGAGSVLIAEAGDRVAGFAVVLRYPCWINRAVSASHELLWWVDEERRGALGRELLDVMDKVLGRAAVSVVSLTEAMRGPAMDRLYRRRGFEPIDRTYMRMN